MISLQKFGKHEASKRGHRHVRGTAMGLRVRKSWPTNHERVLAGRNQK